ncbi:OLC1v1036158C1 [Oldenlandia corymbosa var. corymbosa]|uniref:OLC1v1036158C1 n=1 Tax=Oldenlandia corymbosa var. corymbosa TaxID=529605 RepID=A0AAV1CVV3_OLDCO|nr:OLC1v1036158C1 [Oldenlandia corymbosa var. corymbosa]
MEFNGAQDTGSEVSLAFSVFVSIQLATTICNYHLVSSSQGDVNKRSSLESLFCYDKSIPEEIIEKPVGLSIAEKDIGDNPRCTECEAKGAVLCATCGGSGLYVDSILESQGIIVKVRCLGNFLIASLLVVVVLATLCVWNVMAKVTVDAPAAPQNRSPAVMGGAFRFISLLTAPFQPALHRPTSIIFRRFIARRISTTTSTRHLSLSRHPANSHRSGSVFLTRTDSFRKELHAQAINSDRETANFPDIPTPIIHPWPEWSQLVDTLLSSHWNRPPVNHGPEIFPEDAFVVYEEKKLSDEFIHHASVCLAFSRSRPELLSILSRKDMEVIVANGTPFLFKSALDVARRLRVYLGMEGGNVLGQNNVTFADIMKYILSYACNPSTSAESSLYSKELVESSARSLLRQMTEASFGDPVQKPPASENTFNGGYEQKSWPLRQNVEMKRGDWICQKCNFMNFARNLKCLECEESRPQKQLTGQEWQCPQCNFYNYERNLVCLRCDCEKPGVGIVNNVRSTAQLASVKPNLRSTAFSESAPSRVLENDLEQRQVEDQSQKSLRGYGVPQSVSHSEKTAQSTDFFRQSESDSQNMENNQTEVSKKWFQRVAELHNVKDLPSAISDEEFPEIMPMRKGENRFVVSKKKDRSLASPAYKRHAASGQESSSNFVPFVPFPPGFFARNDTSVSVDKNSSSQSSSETSASVSEKNAMQQTESQVRGSEDKSSNISRLQDVDLDGRSSQSSHSSYSSRSGFRTSGHSGKENVSQSMNSTGDYQQLENRNTISGRTAMSLEGSEVKEPNSLDMSEEAKAERWFRRVAQIKDISELSQIPDEDFPSIMPMRKGVNRFVVSKRKTPLERRLTYSQYRRNLPTESSDPMKKENDTK